MRGLEEGRIHEGMRVYGGEGTGGDKKEGCEGGGRGGGDGRGTMHALSHM